MDKMILGRVGILIILFIYLSPYWKSSTSIFTHQSKAEAANVKKIVAIGDIHGAYPEFVSILQEMRLIDQQLNWSGGNTHLVQTGDSIDRGTRDKDVLDLLMKLEKQAEKAGGRVHALLGNHEVMNIIGDLRYVTREAFAAFATEKSEELREKTYARYLKYRSAKAERAIPRQTFTPDQKFKEDWMEKHPPGYLEQRKSFSDAGTYGRWLSNRNALLKLNETIFLHGGVNEAFASLGYREINERMRREIKTFFETRSVLVRAGVVEEYMDFDESMRQVVQEVNYLVAKGGADDPQLVKALDQWQKSGNWLITNPAGPLWYRGYAQEPEETFKPILDKIKAELGATRFVIGHTPMLNGITNRFGSDVYLIDTGMLRRYYRGRCAALLIEDGKLIPVYPKSGQCA